MRHVQAPDGAADYESMTTSAISGYGDTAAPLDVQREIAVMKKSADAQEIQAKALVELVKRSAPQRPGVGGRIDAYV